MYTSIYIILFSFFLVSANWLIGLAWLAGYTALMISRVPKEETLMEQQFGDEYEAWAAHPPVSSTHSQRVICKGRADGEHYVLEGTASVDTARVDG